MSRLYLRFYFALLGSLIVLALVAAILVHRFFGALMMSGHPPLLLAFLLLVLAAAISAIAFPLVRYLSWRLERLQAAVESLGAGDLSARVAVEGNDEVARLATSFNRAASQIEALVGAHKALLANASHELRTPLARIRMAVELMKQSADPKRKAGLDQDIAEIDALIDEILLTSHLNAVADSHAQEEIDLLGLAAEECARYESVDLDGSAASVRGDPRLLRRMLRNLLENAQRHGLPPIRMSLAAGDRWARIEVADQGVAIPEDQREKLFEPFYRRPGVKDNQGAGLGLSLVRQIAQRHGGSACCSQTGSGCNCFVVRLPLQ